MLTINVFTTIKHLKKTTCFKHSDYNREQKTEADVEPELK